MVVNTVQYMNYMRILDAVKHLGPLAPGDEYAPIFHHRELLAGDRLFFPIVGTDCIRIWTLSRRGTYRELKLENKNAEISSNGERVLGARAGSGGDQDGGARLHLSAGPSRPLDSSGRPL